MSTLILTGIYLVPLYFKQAGHRNNSNTNTYLHDQSWNTMDMINKT